FQTFSSHNNTKTFFEPITITFKFEEEEKANDIQCCVEL
ncbi:MAG: hypothetical protein ACI90V_002492, partial [Bacillariaceae sp.]